MKLLRQCFCLKVKSGQRQMPSFLWCFHIAMSGLVICCIRLWLIAWFYVLVQCICDSFGCFMVLWLHEVSVLSVFVSSPLKHVQNNKLDLPVCVMCTQAVPGTTWFLQCNACMPSIICLNCWWSLMPCHMLLRGNSPWHAVLTSTCDEMFLWCI